MREDNVVIAKELLEVFQARPDAWRAVRHLHSFPRPDSATLGDFFDGWADACPEAERPVVEAIRRRLAVDRPQA